MGDAVVGVAHDEFDRLALGGVAVGETAGLMKRPAPDGRFIGKLHLPVAMTLMVDADGGVGSRSHDT